jgi:UDP-N-acetylmuramate--alanine ligase
MLANKEKIHLIGIGGIGMSGLAQLLLACGCQVSGSDLKHSRLIEKLRNLGMKISIGHSAGNIQDQDLVIKSSAIRKDNPELKAAEEQGIAIMNRAKALALLANKKKAIAVTGAHGKTTTASLISHMLVKCLFKPTVCVGGEIFSLDGNAALGDGQYFVLEADESDGTLLTLHPLYTVVTNIDREHLDYYRNMEQLIETFRKFMDSTKKEGCIFFSQDDLEVSKIMHSLDKRAFGFGLSSEAGILARNIKMQDDQMRFACIYQGKDLGQIILQIPGKHNICNALPAIALGLELGLDFKSIQEALSSYQGVRRRLQLKLKQKDILIFDDYAHHPTEIKATLNALKGFPHKRILAVFQPHRYTRTKLLIDDFGSCFQDADYLIVTDIYSASEVPIEGISAKNIGQKAHEAGIKEVSCLAKEDILADLLKRVQPGDLIAVMGAGDIGSIADELVKELKATDTL